MKGLSGVYIFKIAATLLCWSAPLILFPAFLLDQIGFPQQDTYMWVRMLGWAYLALCVGYAFGLRAALAGEYLEGPVYVGLVSNGGACVYLSFYGLSGTWAEWGIAIQVLAWGSIAATFLITLGLYIWGVRAHA